ncbi:MAG: hypothetical protein J7J01_10615 [Methanophagales archaeon]|nr:hypothetical protein [Methanophagales archaeon]
MRAETGNVHLIGASSAGEFTEGGRDRKRGCGVTCF